MRWASGEGAIRVSGDGADTAAAGVAGSAVGGRRQRALGLGAGFGCHALALCEREATGFGFEFAGALDRLQALFLGLVDAAVDEKFVVAAGYGGLVGGLDFGAQRLAVGLERLGAGALGRAGGGVLRLGVGGQDRGGEHGREQAGHEGAAAGDGRKLGADTDHAWRFPGSGFGVRFGWRVE